MPYAEKVRSPTKEIIESYAAALREDEKSSATVTKYSHDLIIAAEYFDGAELTKSALIEWTCLPPGAENLWIAPTFGEI